MRFGGMSDFIEEDDKSFAELFEGSGKSSQKWFSPGDTVSGLIIKIGKENAFVDLGGKSEGTVDLLEFRDPEGNLTLKEGERVELKVVSVRKGIQLSKAIKPKGEEALEMLRDAQRNQIPVEGRVSAVNKGGFEVDIAGLRAFCPISQIDLAYCEKPEEHVGARYQFRITELQERGKNIVVSRRALLQEEQAKKAEETLAMLKEGLELEGKVTKLTNFGAFVDIGGVEGMVHVSEISHARVKLPSDVLQPGQSVKVKILRIEPFVESKRGGGRRISLSIKTLELGEWDKGLAFHEGDIIPGKVTRLADFGAFVEVAPGVEGLVHVSEISYERIPHPSRVLKEGDSVEVLVQKIDEASRRISLSIKDAALKQKMAQYSSGHVEREVGQVLGGIVEDHKPYGLFVRLPQLGMDVRGLLPLEELDETEKGDLKKRFPRGKEILVEIVALEEERIRLSQKTIKNRKDREDFEKFLQKEAAGKGGLGTLGEIFKKMQNKN
jgi:small subunit ribosomal protein S1